MRETGEYHSFRDLRYFSPYPLPPKNPPLELNTEIIALYGDVNFSLGRLNEMGEALPDAKRYIRAYVIKEALLSSAIEGIHTTLVDVFTQPLEGAAVNKETQLVLNYMQALDVSLEMMREEGLPLGARVLLAAHEALLHEGERASPGQYRRQSVRVGGLVPPLATEVSRLMADLEKYINETSNLPPLIRAGLAHVQFETIHPFLDGNGRIGRLLIVLMLINAGLLKMPILYPSYYFKKCHMEYYQWLDRVRTSGDFEGWIAFYLRAVKESSLDAYRRAQFIKALDENLKSLILTSSKFSKMRETSIDVMKILFENPIIGVSEISVKINRAYNTVQNVINKFIVLGFVTEITEHKRNKMYCFKPYLELLEKEF